MQAPPMVTQPFTEIEQYRANITSRYNTLYFNTPMPHEDF